MKKSKHYKLAMCAVIDSPRIAAEDKLEVLETLMAEKRLAEYGEEPTEPEKAADGT